MEFKKQVLVSFVLLAVLICSAQAACADRREDGESTSFYDDIKCGLSTAGKKIAETASVAGDKIKEGTKKTIEVISKAASKTGEVIKSGYDVAIESSKSGYEYVKDKISSSTTETAENEQPGFDVNKFPERAYDDSHTIVHGE